MTHDSFERELTGRLRAELDRVNGSRPGWSDPVDGGQARWTWIVSGAFVGLVVVAALLVSQLPHGASVAAIPGRSPMESPGALEVITDQGVVDFGVENGSFAISLTTGGVTTELGRAGSTSEVGADFAMVCGPSIGPQSRRYFFGRIDPGSQAQYVGPDAVGSVASNGLFLFALEPGALGSQEVGLLVQGNPILELRAAAFLDAAASGERQASGCYIGH
jgi:hypothetical protein